SASGSRATRGSRGARGARYSAAGGASSGASHAGAGVRPPLDLSAAPALSITSPPPTGTGWSTGPIAGTPEGVGPGTGPRDRLRRGRPQSATGGVRFSSDIG